ncbi:YolD-like family protein [Paenibacillus ginsengihumi]|uniref:YolD-like family protein n=1 Tax=Paenibacillus ginsengihumi TaxID=431596 RepID=UPI00036855A9|nr:YolD-like family protein [Paenibacillus ginsengihumi]
MSKKLQGNGLFESSRMMLPEHKEAYIRHQQNLRKNARPQLDDQEMERISMLLSESMLCKKEVELALFKEFEISRLTGIITKIDRQRKSVRLAQENDYVWVQVADIMDAALK